MDSANESIQDRGLPLATQSQSLTAAHVLDSDEHQINIIHGPDPICFMNLCPVGDCFTSLFSFAPSFPSRAKQTTT